VIRADADHRREEVRRFDAERVSEAQIRERIPSAGFEPAWTRMIRAAERPETAGQRHATERIKIGGMSCSFCVNTIKTAVGRLPGVDEVAGPRGGAGSV
jgi:copper chaperone CopZ